MPSFRRGPAPGTRPGRSRLIGALTLVLLLVAGLFAWDRYAADSGGFGAAGPVEIWHTLVDRRDLLTTAAGATLSKAGLGLLAGSAVGVLAACLAHLLNAARRPLQALMLACYAIPLVALGPILTASLERSVIPVIAAGVSVALPVFSSTAAGLDTLPEGLRALLAIYGTGRWRRLALLSVPGSLPYLLEGIKFAIPSALLGALIGEWFGTERGLGVLIVSGLREGQGDVVGAVSVVVLAVSMTAYAVLARCAGLMQRRRGMTGGA